MPSRIRIYVSTILLAAMVATAALFATAHTLPGQWVSAILCMVGWGLVAQALGHQTTGASAGSIASIPYLAAAFLIPEWQCIAGIFVAESIIAAFKRRPMIKSVFNVSQLLLVVALTILVYRALGGTSMLGNGPVSLLAYCAAIAVFFATNTLAVSGAVAIDQGKPVMTVWRANTRGAMVYDVLAIPLPYFFAQLFVSKGIVGAVMLAAPLLAIRQVFRTSWQLEQATQDLLQLMVKAIEARDPYTSGHSQRVQAYSIVIGRAHGLSAKACERLGKAALLHDVGKIHEMYAPILRKPDKLTPEEWDIMRTHPEKSAELVSAVSHLRDIVPAIRHHHENWDGSGYPTGLRGGEIPLFSRIIAIADTIDAMTTDRAYRTARTLDQVRAELARMGGHQFDPNLCAALLNGPFFAKLAQSIAANNATTNSLATPVSSPVLRSA